MTPYPSFIQPQRLAKTHSWTIYLHEAILGPPVGLPDLTIPDDDLEGMVAEYLWYAARSDASARFVRIAVRTSRR